MAAPQRSRRIFVRAAFLAAAATALVLLLLAPTRAFRWLETGSYDARARFAASRHAADKQIVIIDIDNASFSILKPQFGRWPWSRAIWATEVLRYIRPAHPRVVAFDSILEGKESDEVDGDLAHMLARSGNVVLAYTISDSEVDSTDTTAADAGRALLAREAAPISPATVGEPTNPRSVLSVPLDPLAQAAAGMGSVTSVPDSDGVTRRILLAHKYGDRTYPSLAARATALARGENKAIAFTRDGAYAAGAAMRVPVDQDGRLLLVWSRGGSFAYERIPLWQMVCSIYRGRCPPTTALFEREYFRDKIVILGASATGIYEVRPTPLDETAPGFVSHATAIDNLLHGEGIRLAPGWLGPLAIIVMALAGAAILVRIQSAVADAAVLLAIAVVYSGSAFFVFSRWHLWISLMAPLVALAISFASSSAIRYATTGRELRHTRGMFERYMAPELVEWAMENPINLSGEKRELTILFSDVRSFTTLTEKSDPMVLIAMLNEYLAEMVDVIKKHGGVVDRFIGDGILAYWGRFKPGNHALQGSLAALEMFDRLKALNERWIAKGWPEIDIGVGLNTGEVIFGEVGAGKMEITVIGDPVNLAARLESENKPQGTHIIISEFTLAKLGDSVAVRPLGGVKVKGKTIETQIFELTGLKAAASAAGGAAQK